MKTAIYIRVSTTSQSEEGSSLQAQEELLRKYADLNNLTITEVIADKGISAYSGKRPGFEELMKKVKSKEIDVVLVYSISRFARNTKSLLESVEVMNGNNVKFHSYKEKIDTSSALGNFFLTIIGAMAQMESQQLSERVTDVKRANKEVGRMYSSPIYGFENDKSNHTLVPIQSEMEVVYKIKEMSEYYSMHTIAKKLNEQKIPTKKRKGQWHGSQIHNILNNTVYKF